MSTRSINLRPKLNRLDDIPTTMTTEKRDRRSFAETERNEERLDIPTRKTQSFGAGNTRTPPPPRISVSTIHEDKVFELQRSGTMESGGFERHGTAQNSSNHNRSRKSSKMGKLTSTDAFEVQKSRTIESGGFERNVTAQNSSNYNPYRKAGKMGPPISTGMGAVNPGFTTSMGSSIYGGSLGSLPVVREQYCCWARWTRRERILVAIIGILAFFVLCLLIAVGSLLGLNKDEEPICLPNLFFGKCAETET